MGEPAARGVSAPVPEPLFVIEARGRRQTLRGTFWDPSGGPKRMFTFLQKVQMLSSVRMNVRCCETERAKTAGAGVAGALRPQVMLEHAADLASAAASAAESQLNLMTAASPDPASTTVPAAIWCPCIYVHSGPGSEMITYVH